MSAQQGSIPALSKNDIAKFTQLYQRSKSPDQNFISGEQARGIFMKANIGTDILGSIWALTDVNAAGVLTEPQFVMAMHLIQLFLNKSITIDHLPSVLPQYLWDSISMPGTPSTAASPALSKASLSSTVTGNWTLSQSKKQEFDRIFESLDVDKQGRLSSSKLVPFFLSSKLSQDVLAYVWDLADFNNSSDFSKKEFAIAMFLIQKKKAGVELPEALPQSLLDSVNFQPSAAVPDVKTVNRNVAPSAVSAIPSDSFPAATNAASMTTSAAAAAAAAAPIAAVAAATTTAAASAPVDKEKRINNELNRINATKKQIETKLEDLHVTHDKNVKETEQLELNLIQRQNELKALQKHLDQLELDNTSELTKINQLNENLKIAIKKKNDFTKNITTLKSSSETLTKKIEEDQIKYKQQSSLLDVNRKQLETTETKNNNFQSELSLLSASLPTFISKFTSFLENQKIVEQQHAKLQEKYKGLDNRNNELKAYETKIAEETKEIEDNEQKCDQKIDRLQQLFDEFTARQKEYEAENDKLKSRHVDYAQELQELTERQMKLNLGDIPDNVDDILIKLDMYNKKTVDVDSKIESPSGAASTEGDAREGSDVFDKDIPVIGSQTEGEPDDEQTLENAAEILDDRFEGDLNEYGIPRSQSLTSSVTNNPPLSLREDTIDLQYNAENLAAKEHDLTDQKTSNLETEKDSATPSNDDKEELDLSDNINELQGQSTKPTENYNDIDEEFPPIQEPQLEESDSSDEDEDEDEIPKKDEVAAALNDEFGNLDITPDEGTKPNNEVVDTAETLTTAE
ncbi:hypothetical protein TPHA_0E00390 [Tetrapisispora phaffii CBS 4417]|uniref:Uncharacterized protein n=1 Tax=Tetrapisispora phaffii (strain ATCC 24235 / CBS 4417 / NBRC 1672 / NRRL Y-8282 / UCD 70-5) TaxID=1071381 RepID=G8BTA7_TETPH|nr:hypothetical protein TPHA_0E00390 [Tetrapisispora phaffii CBS 4417]CCE63135.1 hypothetical protein TPHA_0E00390 [Tetrapisispora phaffii CBS 4417]